MVINKFSFIGALKSSNTKSVYIPKYGFVKNASFELINYYCCTNSSYTLCSGQFDSSVLGVILNNLETTSA